MRKAVKAIVWLGILGVLGVAIVYLMNLGSAGITDASSDFRSIALKIAAARVLVIGGSIVFLWGFISRLVAVYFRVEIGPLKYRALFWYALAEAVLIWSVYRI